ncbi:MAG TPA: tetratricopeptide repeat protein [Nitrospirales bacterium]|jgi:tetratricopeptide (TPR) repeat protein
MFKIRKERATLASPVPMAGSIGQVSDAARENLTWLVAGIAVAVVMAIAVGGYFWMRYQEDRAAEDLFHQGMRPFSQATPNAPSPRPEQLQQAVETFRKVLAEYPRSSAAPLAAYMLGNALSALKDVEGATKAYQDSLARYGGHKTLVPLVYQRLGYTYLSQGKMDEAEKAFLKITATRGAPNKDHALYELARIDEILNRPEGALAHYQELIKDHPQSPYTEEASVRIKTLDAKKAPPSPAPSPSAAPSTQAAPK